MSKLSKLMLLTTMVVFLIAIFGAAPVSAKNTDKAAQGNSQWRTWVIYHKGPSSDHDAPHFEVGDAFRLSKDKSGAKKYKFRPLRKLSSRWDVPGKTYNLDKVAKTDVNDENENLMCGKIDVSTAEHDTYLVIHTVDDDLLNIYWALDDSCAITNHPGHAKAEN